MLQRLWLTAPCCAVFWGFSVHELWHLTDLQVLVHHRSIASMFHVQVRNRFVVLCVCCEISPVLDCVYTPRVASLESLESVSSGRVCGGFALFRPCWSQAREVEVSSLVGKRPGGRKEMQHFVCRGMWRFVVEFKMDWACQTCRQRLSWPRFFKSFEIEWALCKEFCQLDNVHKYIACKWMCNFIAETKRGWQAFTSRELNVTQLTSSSQSTRSQQVPAKLVTYSDAMQLKLEIQISLWEC